MLLAYKRLGTFEFGIAVEAFGRVDEGSVSTSAGGRTVGLRFS